MGRRLSVFLVLVLVGATAVAAQPPGKDKGRGQGHDDVRSAKERVKKEAVDAVADELVGTDATSGGRPAGLSKKDKLPPGLEKQGKTPPGWSKGNKKGWDGKASGEPKREGWIRRTVRGIFHRGEGKKD